MTEKLTDYISGQELDATPEEKYATQPFSKILVEDYNYPKALIQTRPQYRVKTTPSDKKGYPVDIAVFEEVDGAKKLKIIVECKAPDLKLSEPSIQNQLKDYMSHSQATIGVLYNGENSIYFLKTKDKNGYDLFNEIQAIPKYQEKLSDIGLYKKANLAIPHNLKDIFREIRGWIVGNGNINDYRNIAKQVILLILCKIYDEKFTNDQNNLTFRATISDTDEEIKNRISTLFDKTKSMYGEVITENDVIDFDGKTLRGIVSKLQSFYLIKSDRDCLADAFEIFIDKAVKDEEGQFFTPRNVVKVIIEAVNVGENDVVIDSACGSGGFLVETLKRFEWIVEKKGLDDSAKNEFVKKLAIRNIRGLDKDEFLTKLSKAYMAILGDGSSGIFREDSLDIPQKWERETQNWIKLGEFDALLANPPFGKDIKPEGEDKLAQYTLAYKTNSKGIKVLQKQGNVSTLFLERNMQFVKDGGRIGIILPEPYFAVKKYMDAMDFMLNNGNNNIQWVIDLPHDTFRPHNNAKCCAIVIQKGVRQQEMVNMVVLEHIGHNHLGKPTYDDSGNLIDDTPQAIEEIKERNNNSGLLVNKYSNPKTFRVQYSEILKNKILVPRFYWQQKISNIQADAKKQNITLVSMRQLEDEGVIKVFDGHGSPSGQLKGEGDVPYIRVKDIVNWQPYIDVTSLIPRSEYNRLFKQEKALKAKDILYVSRGSYRIGSVAMVSPYDGDMLLTREIKVIRLLQKENKYGLTAEYMLYALSHKLVWEQTQTKVFYEPCLPNISDRWRDVCIPIFNDKQTYDNWKKRAKEIVDSQWKAKEKITEIRQNANAFLI